MQYINNNLIKRLEPLSTGLYNVVTKVFLPSLDLVDKSLKTKTVKSLTSMQACSLRVEYEEINWGALLSTNTGYTISNNT